MSISPSAHTSTERLSSYMCSHFESVKLDDEIEIFVDHETCALRYPVWSEFYTSGPFSPV